ncbi:DeoR/GlpR family DNA-binding transcription regulator [Halobacillus yeomjeoni]|uniref:DeoR/GlpR transcriptional regulator n=1 Tax=Halobacillus yeomjeoni TaxID=311194 RepID=A0A931HWM4_9BACI|nr:DeoR/GlpR family DNA-binding transcription regulator [Halobacillus yeomjeoni]MBH0230959.1 DeoR/GlpR transcriptional regulator [Halobacillus yeomjeoni]
MLTTERHRLILDLLEEKQIVKLKDLVQHTDASESTIRRDLDQLEQEGQLRRVHGGASLKQRASEEPTLKEKITKLHNEKEAIARQAASLVQEGDSIFLDAGTTTHHLIPHLQGKDIIVVTNGLNHLDALTDHSITTYILGGYIKHRTKAVVGTNALENLKQYRFDLCFMGTNGISLNDGYTTPDPEEAALKKTALNLSRQRYVLADHSKFTEVSFSKFANLNEADIITNYKGDQLKSFKEMTSIKVVNT